MKNSCILITYEYPFIYSEPFLESEINYLSKTFDKIFIFCVDAKSKDIQTRNTPFNVRVYKLGLSRKFRKLLIFKKNKSKFFYTRNKNFFKKIADKYFLGCSNVISKKIYSLLEKEDILLGRTVIYSYWMTYLSMAGIELSKMLINSKKAKNVFTITRCHSYDVYRYRNSMNYIPFQEQILENVDFVCPCSLDAINYLNDLFDSKYNEKLLLARLSTTNMGYNKSFPKKNTFVTCSSLYVVKRLDLFAKAFSIFIKKFPDWKWICIGNGPEESKIKNIVKENAIEKNVLFLGRKTNSEVLNYYKENDIGYFVNVSSSEGVPVSIMEAQSFAIPCIATDVGGTKEIVNNDNGLLIPKNISAEDLSIFLENEITEVFENDIKYKAKCQKSRKDWEEKSWDEINYQKWSDFLLNGNND